MKAFVKIRLTFLDDFNFGQDSLATSKTYLQLPFDFINNHVIRMLNGAQFGALVILISDALTSNSHIINACKTTLKIPNKTSLNAFMQPLIDLQLIEIVDAAVSVKKRKEEKKKEKKRIPAPSDSQESLKAEIVIPEFDKIKQTLLSRKVNLKSQQAILQAYPEPEWVISEINKALAWEAVNPRNRKKDFARFVNGWLSRGWDKRPRQASHSSSSLDDLVLT